MHIWEYIIMLRDFVIHMVEATQVGLDMNIFGYNCNSVEMAGNTYSMNTTLCWVM